LNIYNKSKNEVLRILISKLSRMGHFICQYIKRDGSICGKGCWCELRCARHFKAILKQYALSVRREPILILESVVHMVEFMTMPGAKVKKTPSIKDLQEGKLSTASLL